MFYTLKEVRRHNNSKSCWLVVRNKVYDVTKFLELHPEHTERVLRTIGEDITIDYDFHTTYQKKIWEKYKIGKIKKKSYCGIM